ncbi:hypothetical protein GCAAIG_13160 [Candidatus Electronema halotolerans]
MWKKMSVAIVLGLSLSPSAVMATTEPFSPFAGIVEGIAQSMAAGSYASESNYDGDTTGNGARMAGNVIIGSEMDSQQQVAVVEGTVSLTMNGSSDTAQALNYNKHNGGTELPVLIMQGATISGGVEMASSNSQGSEQGINVVIGDSGL